MSAEISADQWKRVQESTGRDANGNLIFTSSSFGNPDSSKGGRRRMKYKSTRRRGKTNRRRVKTHRRRHRKY